MNDNAKISSLAYKWYEFFVIYAIIHLFFFYACFELGVEPHEGQSVFESLIVQFLEMINLIVTLGFFVILEWGAIFIFRLVYFRTEVVDEEKEQLGKYIKYTLLSFILIYLLYIILIGKAQHIILLFLIYLPLPIFTFLFIYLKLINSIEKIASSETAIGQELLPPKEKKIKSFASKWYEFLAIYGLINLLFGSLCLKLGFFPDFFADFTHDTMEGFTGVLMLLIVMPFQIALFIFYIIIGIGLLFLLEFVSILIFRYAYFRSEVIDEEKSRLSRYVYYAIICLALAYLFCIFLFDDIQLIVLYLFIYLPIPLFTFTLIYLKLREKGKIEKKTGRKINWETILIYLSLIFGIYFCISIIRVLFNLFA
ncbi:MAG: hypothetical protein ACOX2X_05440 [Peptococcia bacterium]|jgi:hypothetical protein